MPNPCIPYQPDPVALARVRRETEIAVLMCSGRLSPDEARMLLHAPTAIARGVVARAEKKG